MLPIFLFPGNSLGGINTEMSSMPEKIGPFEIIRSLGKGGMGEVLLAKDPQCGRLIALKKIREDLLKHATMHDRFLREAKIAAKLTHPSIIPIYTISEEKNCLFYTMPYVEGETLKEILHQTRVLEKQADEKQHPIGSSIPALMRIFLNICQEIAYVHSKGILHRDLKPDNTIIGKFGEVMILDWGLADFSGEKEILDEEMPDFGELTSPGKIPGTLAYMAPERAHGEASSYLTDIYALGVILYQLLTLKLPFHRTTLKDYRKWMEKEELIDPVEAAPYRDVPLQLAGIAKRCLSRKKEERYQKVQELIEELQNYIEGRPEWIPAAKLQISNKKDWEFQENILLTKHLALTRRPELMEWVNLMISKASFPGNIKLETKISLGSSSKGVGILLCIPEAQDRVGLADGYWLWISSSQESSSKLFRSNVEVMSIPNVGLTPDVWHTLCVEKMENHLRFYLNGKLQCHYISHRPIVGTHVGLLFRDADFQMDELKISVGSQSVEINCLAVPDAFLASRIFGRALSEYRRIGYSFPGRAEGREALFRAGITLLEEAQAAEKKTRKQTLFSLALNEFGKLHNTPGAPLEYLGKSLVYKAWKETEDELKCLELALRKYPKHPLHSILVEEILFRLHQSATQDRKAGYLFALLTLRQLPQIFASQENATLLESLKNNLEPLFFIEKPQANQDPFLLLSIQLAFWLAKPITLVEIIEQTKDVSLVNSALFALLQLGCTEWVRENLLHTDQSSRELFEIATQPKKFQNALNEFKNRPLFYAEERIIQTIFDTLLDQGKSASLLPHLDLLTEEQDPLRLRTLLYEKKWDKAEALFEKYSPETLANPNSPLFPLYGSYLRGREGEEVALAHFSVIDDLLFPPTPSLLAYFLLGKIDFKKGWGLRAFFWEKVQLLRQLVLYYKLAGSPKASLFQKELLKELKSISRKTS